MSPTSSATWLMPTRRAFIRTILRTLRPEATRTSVRLPRLVAQMANQSKIVVSGAREHNLKDVSLELPRDALVVITGLSGSGKSSLAFDTIYAEGQRRYVESLSAYARQFLGQMDKPDVDSIEGLSPAISIDQKTTSRNPRSTVGTVTEIYDYLRLLWSRVGKPHCHVCGAPIEGQSVEQIVDRVLEEIPERGRFMVLAPIVRGRKGEYGKVLRGAARGRLHARGRERRAADARGGHRARQALQARHRGRRRPARHARGGPQAPHGVGRGGGRRWPTGSSRSRCCRTGDGDGEERTMLFSERFACLRCGTSMPELEPRIFSFNSPHGACTRCTGLGTQMEIDPELVVPDPDMSINDGALAPWANSAANYYEQLTEAIATTYGVDLDKPWRELKEGERDLFLYGTAGERVKVTYRNRYGRTRTYMTKFEGIVPNLERRYKETDSEWSREKIEEFMSVRPCPECHGSRLRPESRSVLVVGHGDPRVHGAERAARPRVDRRARALGDRPPHRAAHPARDRGAAAVPRRRRHRLPLDGPRGGDALGRRGAAHPAGDADRLGARRRPLRARRAVDRPAPAGQLEAHRDARAAARPRQHGARRRARRADDAGGRQPHRPRPGRRRARRAGRRAGHGGRRRARCPESLTGQFLSGTRSIAVPEKRRKPTGSGRDRRRAGRTTSRTSTSASRSGS